MPKSRSEHALYGAQKTPPSKLHRSLVKAPVPSISVGQKPTPALAEEIFDAGMHAALGSPQTCTWSQAGFSGSYWHSTGTRADEFKVLGCSFWAQGVGYSIRGPRPPPPPKKGSGILFIPTSACFIPKMRIGPSLRGPVFLTTVEAGITAHTWKKKI